MSDKEKLELISVLFNKMPAGCFECPLVMIGGDLMCVATRKRIIDDSRRPTWCRVVKQKDGEE
jgi:hypothetical protein